MGSKKNPYEFYGWKLHPPSTTGTLEGVQGSCPPWSWSGHNPKAHHRSGCFYPQVFRRTFVRFVFQTSKNSFVWVFGGGTVIPVCIFCWRVVGFLVFSAEEMWFSGSFCLNLWIVGDFVVVSYKLSMIFKFFVSNRQTQRVKPELPHSSGHGLIFGAGGGSGPILSILKISYSQIGNLPHIWVRLSDFCWMWLEKKRQPQRLKVDMDVSENSEFSTPNHPLKKRVFHHKASPFWGTTIFGNIHIWKHHLAVINGVISYPL